MNLIPGIKIAVWETRLWAVKTKTVLCLQNHFINLKKA